MGKGYKVIGKGNSQEKTTLLIKLLGVASFSSSVGACYFYYLFSIKKNLAKVVPSRNAQYFQAGQRNAQYFHPRQGSKQGGKSLAGKASGQ